MVATPNNGLSDSTSTAAVPEAALIFVKLVIVLVTEFGNEILLGAPMVTVENVFAPVIEIDELAPPTKVTML